MKVDSIPKKGKLYVYNFGSLYSVYRNYYSNSL